MTQRTTGSSVSPPLTGQQQIFHPGRRIHCKNMELDTQLPLHPLSSFADSSNVSWFI